MSNLQRNGSSSDLWGLILAAGEGRRLEEFVQHRIGKKIPKQYVNLVGRRSMLEHTFDRAERLIPESKIVTVVGRHHLNYADVRRQLSPRRRRNVVVQPANKETGPGILLPLMHIYKRSPEATVAVFPADHFICAQEALGAVAQAFTEGEEIA